MSVFLSYDGVVHLASVIKTQYALKSHGTHVTFTTTLPASRPYAATGTAATVSRSDHSHSYVPIAGNTSTYPMQDHLYLINTKSVAGITADAAATVAMVALNAANSLVIGGHRTGNTGNTILYGGYPRIVETDAIRIRNYSDSGANLTGVNGLYLQNTAKWDGGNTGRYEGFVEAAFLTHNTVTATNSDGTTTSVEWENLCIGENGGQYNRMYLFGGYGRIIYAYDDLVIASRFKDSTTREHFALCSTGVNLYIKRPFNGGVSAEYVNIDSGNLSKYSIDDLGTIYTTAQFCDHTTSGSFYDLRDTIYLSNLVSQNSMWVTWDGICDRLLEKNEYFSFLANRPNTINLLLGGLFNIHFSIAGRTVCVSNPNYVNQESVVNLMLECYHIYYDENGTRVFSCIARTSYTFNGSSVTEHFEWTFMRNIDITNKTTNGLCFKWHAYTPGSDQMLRILHAGVEFSVVQKNA